MTPMRSGSTAGTRRARRQLSSYWADRAGGEGRAATAGGIGENAQRLALLHFAGFGEQPSVLIRKLQRARRADRQQHAPPNQLQGIIGAIPWGQPALVLDS